MARSIESAAAIVSRELFHVAGVDAATVPYFTSERGALETMWRLMGLGAWVTVEGRMSSHKQPYTATIEVTGAGSLPRVKVSATADTFAKALVFATEDFIGEINAKS